MLALISGVFSINFLQNLKRLSFIFFRFLFFRRYSLNGRLKAKPRKKLITSKRIHNRETLLKWLVMRSSSFILSGLSSFVVAPGGLCTANVNESSPSPKVNAVSGIRLLTELLSASSYTIAIVSADIRRLSGRLKL